MRYCIYKIVCDDLPDYVYVGSTMNFINRKWQHKNICNNINSKGYNYKIYQIIRENGGWANWRMVVIHECDEGLTKTQAEIIEEEHRVTLNANMNTVKCFRTDEEKKEWFKKYNVKYHETNKEVLNEKSKEYYNNNKNDILEKAKEKMTCECGSIFSKNGLYKHKKTNKHISFQNIY